MISTGKLVVLLRVAAAAATAAALLFLATVPANAQKPPPPPTPRAADVDGDKVFDDLENLISPANLDQTFPTVVLLEQPVTAGRINGLQSSIGQFDLEFEYDSVDGFAASLTKGQILALSQLDQVVQIEADRPVKLFLDTSTLWFGVQQARTDFGVDGNADGADTYSTGDMVIAVLDTGIDAAHVDLNGGKVVGWADFHTGSGSDPVCGSPCDPHGHGTHVSSIATGEGEGNALYRGVAPGAALVGVRVLSKSGSGSISGVNAGLQWVIDNKDTYNIRIINMSLGTWGCSDGTDSLSLMVNNVVAAGIVAVVSAGNSGPASCTIASPAAAEEAITVAAMADVGQSGFSLAYFSSRGPTADGRTKPDIAAPGRYITAARGGSSNGYTSMSGTSMSSPFVAGVAALMLDADPTLTPSQVKSTLMNTAIDWGPAGKDNDYGAGRLDAYEAVRVAKNASGSNITVPNHQYVSGNLSATGDSDSYTISVTDATKPIAITMVMPTWVSGSFNIDIDMELRDKDNVRVAISQIAWRQETIGLSSPTNGPYTLRVYSYFGSGPYFFDSSVGGGIEGLSRPTLNLDTPAPSTMVRQPFLAAGWAIDQGAVSGTGVNAVHVYAYPSDASGNPVGAPIFLGSAAYGRSRPDVGVAFGAQFTNSGYHLWASGLNSGFYSLVVYAHSTVTGDWLNSQRVIRVQPPAPAMAIDTLGQTTVVQQPFRLSGWAIDRAAASGSGVNAVHVYAYPLDASGNPSGTPVFLGAAGYGGSRPDVGNAFGAQFTNSAYKLTLTGLAGGYYRLVTYAHSTISGQWQSGHRLILVPPAAMSVDTPRQTAVQQPFRLSGWAIDRAAAVGPGVDAVRMYAYPSDASGNPIGGPIYLNAADYGKSRPDVGNAFGAQFTNSAYELTVTGLAAGYYHIVIYAHSTVSGAWQDGHHLIQVSDP